jgi:ribonuclease HII
VLRIAGVDEAGRGPLAGPLVVAAVILPPGCWLPGLNDSKKLTAAVRERLDGEIRAVALAYAIEVIPVARIDELNILRATHVGMRAALRALSPAPELALIDGLPLPDSPVPQHNLVKGDARSASIAAASILAKVTRDRAMVELDHCYPQYGFSRHKGYPTAEHLLALQRYGVSPVHRLSYAPVRNCRQMTLPDD